MFKDVGHDKTIYKNSSACNQYITRTKNRGLTRKVFNKKRYYLVRGGRIMEQNKGIKVKIVVIGSGGVGKTSIAKRYLGEEFQEEYLKTIGADFYVHTKTYTLEQSDSVVQWMIWDLGGQPAFDEVRGMYYEGAKGALLVYDISRPETYHNLPQWINEYWQNTDEKYPFVLVANKKDLRGKSKREVPTSAGKNYAEKLSQSMKYTIPYVETSAKENENIEKSFDYLANLILEWIESTSITF